MPMNSSKPYSFLGYWSRCLRMHGRTCAVQIPDTAFLIILYRPERWEAIPEAVNAIPSVFGNLMTFITGAHACIGYRFAVTE